MNRDDNDAVTVHYREGKKVLEVCAAKAVFKGLSWKSLGGWGKRKFENFIFLKNNEDRKVIKFHYV